MILIISYCIGFKVRILFLTDASLFGLHEIPSECSQLYVARSLLPQTVVIDPRSFGVEPEVGSIDGLDDSKILVARLH